MTPLMELADLKLNGGLEEFVRSRRAQTPRRPWRLIAIDIRDATGLDVTDQTLRVWFPEDDESTEAAS